MFNVKLLFFLQLSFVICSWNILSLFPYLHKSCIISWQNLFMKHFKFVSWQSRIPTLRPRVLTPALDSSRSPSASCNELDARWAFRRVHLSTRNVLFFKIWYIFIYLSHCTKNPLNNKKTRKKKIFTLAKLTTRTRCILYPRKKFGTQLKTQS